MLATKIEQKKNEEGFTLIELLVVVIIIGILAAIAIPVFLNQRSSAWLSAVESDLRNIAIELETAYTNDLVYPGAATADMNASPFVTTNVHFLAADGTETAAANAVGFCLSGTHANLDGTPDAIYNSLAGGIERAPAADCVGALDFTVAP